MVSELFAEWNRRRLYRRYLSEMSDYELSDIGISRDLAERESAQSFWVGPIKIDTRDERRLNY